MISYEEALSLVFDTVSPLGEEDVPVAQATGRVLAADVHSRVDSPPFNKAAMDGFAVRSEDVSELVAELQIVGESFAGGWPHFTVGPGQSAKITTGSPVPEGADMVVMVEHTEELDGDRVRVLKLSGGNLCPRGEDVRRGQTVLRAGEVITPLRIGVASGAGHGRLRVFLRPRIRLMCTGTEVVEPGAQLQAGQIYNANAPMLSALLAPWAGDFEYLGVVGDEQERLRQMLQRGLDSDMLVISGGVSVGPYDLVPRTLEQLGVQEVFHNCAIKPGKPTYLGTREGGLVFGMPGNPLSCFVIYQVLVRWALARQVGHGDAAPVFCEGIMGEDFENKPGRRRFLPCSVRQRRGAPHLLRTRSHGSADIAGAVGAEALLTLPADCKRVKQAQKVCFLPLPLEDQSTLAIR